MWSYLQYRRIGGEVKARVEKVLADGGSPRDCYTVSMASFSGEGERCEEYKEHRLYVQSAGIEEPLDPKNWPLLDRCKNIGILSLLIFVQGWAGAAESMA